VDLARAVAIAGMVVAHFAARGEPGALDAIRAFVDGRAMPLFVVLFGVSISLLARHGAHPDRALLVRAAVLAPLGIALQEATVGIAVVLDAYALWCLAAIGLRRLGDRALLAGAVVVTAVAAVARQLLGPRWPSYTGWDGGRGLVPPWGYLAHLTVNGYYPALPSLAFVLVGLWIGRRDLADARVAVRLAAIGAIVGTVGYVGGRAIGDRAGATGVVERDGAAVIATDRVAEVGAVYGITEAEVAMLAPDDEREPRAHLEAFVAYAQDRTPAFHAVRLLDVRGHSQMPAWVVGSTGTACAALGLCLLVARRPRARRALAPLVALGQLSLTAYVAQALVIRWTPSAADTSTAQQFAIAMAVVGATTLFAWAWRARFRRGPLEAALHAAATGRRTLTS
jgi:uncharacterized membrane protein